MFLLKLCRAAIWLREYWRRKINDAEGGTGPPGDEQLMKEKHLGVKHSEEICWCGSQSENFTDVAKTSVPVGMTLGAYSAKTTASADSRTDDGGAHSCTKDFVRNSLEKNSGKIING